MPTPSGEPGLRLAGPADDPADAVRRENADAIGLAATDPRWVLAVRVQAQLDGACLTPARRAGILRTASALGLRPFDASMIIAIVQDHARRGATLAEAAGTLALLRAPARTGGALRRWIAAGGCALVAALLLARWILAAG